MSVERSVRARGKPNAEELRAAKAQYTVYDDNAAIEYDLLSREKNLSHRKYARFVHLSELKQNKGKL